MATNPATARHGTRRINAMSARDASGPPALPFVGHVPAFVRDKLGFLSRCAREYGDVVRLAIGGRTYLLSAPADIGHVLLSDNYEKSSRIIGPRGRRFFGKGLVTTSSAEHLRQRRLLQPAFHRAIVERFATLILDEAERMIEHWKPGVVFDLNQAMLELTQRIILRALLGDASPETLERLGRAVSVRRRYQEYLLGTLFPISEWVSDRRRIAHARAEAEITTILRNAIHDRRRAPQLAAPDLLRLLVDARYADGVAMNDELVLDEARSLAIAGYETVAEALTWTWYLLGTSPAVEAELCAEVTALGRDRLHVGDLARLPLFRMVLAESMRLYPPTWMFVRVAREADVLPGGTRIPPGSKIYLSQWVMHRHEKYFPEADRFDPRRFTDAAVRERPRYTYFPFGGGRRLCIGEEFAWTEGVLLLATIVHRFRLFVAPGQTIVPEPNLTLRPRCGLLVEPRRR